jgi:hypothetical protein
VRASRLAACMAPCLALALVACNGGGGTDEDTTTEDTATEEDTTTGDTATEPDVADDKVDEDAAGDVPADEGRDCSGTYPGGPFGWKGSIRYTGDTPYWDGNGDYLDNIRLADTTDAWTFPAQHYCSTEIDVLFYDFTAMWCPPCNQAADEEGAFITWMGDHGWRVAFMSVVEEDPAGNQPTLANAQTWKSSHGIESDVLYDPMWYYHRAPFMDTWPEEAARGWPSFFVVNPDNMMIWATFSGWRGSYPQETFFSSILDLFELAAANDPGYIP